MAEREKEMKPDIRIIRLESGIQTFGSILFNGEVLGNSLELPWKMNAQNISCILH